jgi:hypothetical protein
MKPIDLLIKELDKKKKHLKLFKARGIAYDYEKTKRELEEDMLKYEGAIVHLEEMERLNKYHATLAVIQLLSCAYPKKKLPKGLAELKYQPSEYERVETVKRILKRTIISLDEKRLKKYNKLQLETTCNRTRSEIGWLADALGL